MDDYKQMYLKLFRASERAIEILIDAHRKCEELYLSTDESPDEGDAALSEFPHIASKTAGL